ncbi:hypothetical protein JY23_06440, partial [Neisseria meningitidis]
RYLALPYYLYCLRLRCLVLIFVNPLYAGMAGLSGQISLTVPVLLTAQVLWVIIPLVLAAGIFRKRQI